MIPAVWRNPDGKALDRAAVGQAITFSITPQGALEDIVPGVDPPNTGDQTILPETLTISKSKAYPIKWSGEEQKALGNGDKPQINEILRDQFTQAFRTIANAVEADLASLFTEASRAHGTPGTLPFGTSGDLSDFAQSLKILNKNGAGTNDLHMVLSNESAANVRGNQATLFQVNTSGNDDMLRRGELGRVQKFAVGESNQILPHEAGDGAGYTTDATGYAIGAKEIALITGTGEIKAGDTVTFAGDSNKYIVSDGISAPGTITIGGPGLLQAIPAAATAVTVLSDSQGQNMFFSRNAIVLATRAPAVPEGGDSAADSMMVTDPFTGLSFEVSMYKQYKQTRYEVALAWGYKMVKPEHAGVLLS